ncbi:MAG: hypothetical protein XD58_1509 [Thermotoga sp. 50_1627]|uniref:DUF6917 domain-containing protein n=1 Tax=Pseudothermotoga sp. TaxID=2033661 RepID=UPI00076BFA40|nr:MAG: hypothetical protein XD45_1553 [Thermotoga sp. 50_64]KUK24505.1 MAG: hypothetical protein XD58_1509 [Thermotoga sp. 50_1627]MBC7117054.1 hypothetical protein [Pseudothermotoga sp.]MDK2923183.1 hypothetical protein [Pseudothermotoga sp.]HBT40407.1 hypothetical protein [Pseudothermotoga sp.]
MKEPYSAGMLKFDPYAKKQPVIGKVVAVLRGRLDNRNLSLIEPRSRALKIGEIHEILMTDEEEAAPGKTVNRVAYVAFVEIVQAGVIVSNDVVKVSDGRQLGKLVGFDETHMPNHQNIVIYSDQLVSGEELGLEIGEMIIFEKEV